MVTNFFLPGLIVPRLDIDCKVHALRLVTGRLTLSDATPRTLLMYETFVTERSPHLQGLSVPTSKLRNPKQKKPPRKIHAIRQSRPWVQNSRTTSTKLIPIFQLPSVSQPMLIVNRYLGRSRRDGAWLRAHGNLADPPVAQWCSDRICNCICNSKDEAEP
jgi:hypothetical protein